MISKVEHGEIQRRRSIDVGFENICTKKWGAEMKRCVASGKKLSGAGKKVGIKMVYWTRAPVLGVTFVE